MVEGLAEALANGGLEIGDYRVSARASKSRFLICQGQAVSRTTYADLFAVIGTAFGAGDGSTTFNLPDGRGRTLVGVGAGPSLTNRAMGAKGGEESHVLTATEQASMGVSGSFSGSGSGTANIPVQGGGGITNVIGANPASANSATFGVGVPVSVSGSISGTASGGGGAHNNMQPFLAAGNLFIYAGK